MNVINCLFLDRGGTKLHRLIVMSISGYLIKKWKSIEIPWPAIHCIDCIYKEHSGDILQFQDQIVSAYIDASRETISYSSEAKKERVFLDGMSMLVSTEKMQFCGTILGNVIIPQE